MNKELALSGREDKTRDLLLFSGSNVLAMVRHGEPDLPSSGSFFLGSADRGLSRQGRSQASVLADWASRFSWRGCFCSPVTRARQTADIICGALGIEPQEKGELAEIDLGEWDGREKQEISMEFPGLWEQREKDLYNFRYPGGESFADLEARALPFLTHLIGAGGRWLIVSHAGILRVLLHSIFRIEFSRTFRFDPGYGGIRLLEKDDGAISVRGFKELTSFWREQA